jgi:hypothetical protein
MKLENIILSEISQVQKVKNHIFSHLWNTDLIQTQQYCENQVMLMGGHIQEEGVKRGN